MATAATTGSSQSAFFFRAARAWDQFWFRPADPTLLGFIRLCCGLLVFYIHLGYSFDLEPLLSKNAWVDLRTADMLRHDEPTERISFDWQEVSAPQAHTPEDEAYYQTWGTYPQTAVAKGQPRWSIWFHVTDPKSIRIVHCGILLVMFCFAIGLCTRIMAVLTWLAVVSYINRAETTVFGMDTMQNLVVLYLMIGPSGAAFSVDRLLSRYLAVRRARRHKRPIPPWPNPAPSVSANFALRLMQINFCLVYLVSGLSKLQGAAWWRGDAVWITMANPEFSPLDYKLYVQFLKALSRHRWLCELFVTGSTLGSLAFEVSFIFLVWRPSLRWFMLLGVAIFHLSIAFFMGLVPFSLIMMVFVLAFVPSPAFTELLERSGLRTGQAGGLAAPA